MSDFRSNGTPLPPTSQIEVLVVYESQLLSSALMSLLVQDREIAPIGAALTGHSAGLCLQHANADVVLCGIRYAEDVAHVVAPILSARPESRVLVLGPTRNERAQIASIEAGAVGYVGEDIAPISLLQAIKRIHAGEVLYGQSVLIGLTHRSERGSRPMAHSFDAPTLGPRETEVLQAFVLGLSTVEVAERLGITVSTVRTHMKKALEKLGAHSKLEAAITALRQGIIALPQEDDA